MGKIPAKFRLGKPLEGDSALVQKQLDDAYTDISSNLNVKPDMLIFDDTAPTSNDYEPDLSSFWLNRDLTGGTPELYIMTVKNRNSATWVQIF